MPFVDDEGRLPGDLFALKNFCFPAEALSEDECRKYLSQLHDVRLINFAEGSVIELLGFMDNQKIGHRPAKSLYPEYQEVTGKGEERSERFAEVKPALSSINLTSIKSFIKIQHLKLSKEEYDKLVEDFDKSSVDQVIADMQNYAKLKNYTSANLTARKWLKRNKETAPKPQQVNPAPQQNSYFCEKCETGFSSADGKCPSCGSQGL
jgi:rubrerythrin